MPNGYGVPSSGGDYGLAYGMGQALSGIPAAVMQGEEIKRRREQQDFEMAAKRNAYDRLMTEQQINDYVPGEIPQVDEPTIAGYTLQGDDSGKVYSPDEVAKARTTLGQYADLQGNISTGPTAGDQIGYGAAAEAKNIGTLFSPKYEAKKRDMNEYEKAAWLAQKKADFAASKGRGDLSAHYLGEAMHSRIRGQYDQVHGAIGMLKGGNLSNAKDAINKIGTFGHVDSITQNDNGSYDFHTPEGIHTFENDQLDQIDEHFQQMLVDPAKAMQYLSQQRVRGREALERANVRERGVEAAVAGRKEVAQINAGVRERVAKDTNATREKIAATRGKGGGAGGSGRVPVAVQEVNAIAIKNGHVDAKGNPKPTADDFKEKLANRAAAGPAAKAEQTKALLDSLSGKAQRLPETGKPATQVNPANKKTYYLHSDGKYYLAPPK